MDTDRFNCPKCGGHNWGTYGHWKPEAEWVGHCNGYIVQPDGSYIRCEFRWPRTDDHKYGMQPFHPELTTAAIHQDGIKE